MAGAGVRALSLVDQLATAEEFAKSLAACDCHYNVSRVVGQAAYCVGRIMWGLSCAAHSSRALIPLDLSSELTEKPFAVHLQLDNGKHDRSQQHIHRSPSCSRPN